VGILSWLGIRHGDEYPNLDALLKELRRALPDHESVVLRYIAIVVILLSKVAWADGGFSAGEDEALRALLAHIDKISPSGVEAVCSAVRGKPPEVNEQELALCYRELKALCDGRERMEVMRLLTQLAAADGEPTETERAILQSIADELGIPADNLASVVKQEAPSEQREGRDGRDERGDD
jgi:DnaJ like chaperone protein